MEKLIKKIIWEDKVIDPTEILIAFWESKGAKFTDYQLKLMRFYKPETITRLARDIPKPTRQKRLI